MYGEKIVQLLNNNNIKFIGSDWLQKIDASNLKSILPIWVAEA